ncbi:MAG TPA: hypothetical protein DIT66_04565 [Rhodobiaceae bacterium]|mgnify:FL=1|nr:MAG: Uncharacterised protein [Rhodobiaceae bacterium UBA7378]HCQ82076.1 hypothetical protein [Rhodobiaceae bacterium]|tara:strand:- start:1474 stop:2013 length:540 start_codon:yes stop_codon:yes gene_type:complete
MNHLATPLFSIAFVLLLLIAVLLPLPISAQTARDTRPTGDSGLPLPRFVSIKSDAANVRRGPGHDYPLLWQYQRQGLPVEIIAEYGAWRQIRDHQGAEGWMKAPLLRGLRTLIVRQSAHAVTLRATPAATGGVIALVQPGVIGTLEDCEGSWCEIEVDNYDGWLQRDQIWGVYGFEFRD